jgi:hypothetical protein
MTKKILLVVICLIGLVIFISPIHGQGPKKTITLPNGDMIHDLNGEWEAYIDELLGTRWEKVTIKQTGSLFVVTRMHDWGPYQKGSVAMQGELDKNGLKQVQLRRLEGLVDGKGQISEDGNKLKADNGKEGREKSEVTLTRK